MDQNKINDYLKKIKELDSRINEMEEDDIDESVEDVLNDINKINEVLSNLEKDFKPKVDIESITNELFNHLFGEFRLNYSSDEDKKSIIRNTITRIVNQ